MEAINKSLNFWIEVNLAYGFSAGGSLYRDIDLNENIYSSYWLDYQSQCWGTRLYVESQPDQTSVMVTFNLIGLNLNLAAPVWSQE